MHDIRSTILDRTVEGLMRGLRSIFSAVILCFSLLSTGLLAGNDRLDEVRKAVLQGSPQTVRQLIEPIAESASLPENELLSLSEFLRKNGYLSMAILLLEKHRSGGRFSAAVEEQLARYYVESDQSAKAIELYEDLGRKHPSNRDYWLRLGEIYLWNEKHLEAIQAYEKAVALDTSDIETQRKLLQLYQWNDRGPDAFRLRRRILEQEPDNLELWKEHGIQARWVNSYNEAISAFSHILKHDPKNVEAYFLLGETYLWTNELQKAEVCFRQVLRLQPDHLQARFYYAEALRWRPFGWWQARKSFRQVLERQPDHRQSREALDQIRREYGPLLSTRAQTLHDSNDLSMMSLTLEHERFLSARWQLLFQALYHRLEEIKLGVRSQASGQGFGLGTAFYLTPTSRVRALGGVISYDAGKETFGLAELQWLQTWPGHLYTTTWGRYDQVQDGVLAIKRKFYARRLGQRFYWEPSGRFRAGADLQYSLYSDDNRKIELFSLAELTLLAEPVGLFLEGIYAYQDMKITYPDAVPYWTPDNFWSRSLGLGILLPLRPSLSVRGGLGVTQQTGEEIAANWKAEAIWRPGKFSFVRLAFQEFGSKFYSYRSLVGEFQYRF